MKTLKPERKSPCLEFTHLLLFSFLGDVALLDAHGSQEVPEVAEQGDDAVAYVGHDGHVHGRLLKGLMPGVPLGADTDPRAMFLLNNRSKTDNITQRVQ